MTKQFWIGYITGLIVGALAMAIAGFWLGLLACLPIMLVALWLAWHDENKT